MRVVRVDWATRQLSSFRSSLNSRCADERETSQARHRRTGNLRAVQLLLGHTKIDGTVRYLGAEVDDASA